MRIEGIAPDIASGAPPAPAREKNGAGFAGLVDAAAAQLDAADRAEAAFAQGRGGLQEMVIARARADITVSVAATGVQRAAQALNTLLGMQI